MKDPLPHFRLTAGAARKAFTAASKRVSMKSFCARQVVLGRKCRWTFCLVRRPQSVSRHLPVKCPPKKCMTMPLSRVRPEARGRCACRSAECAKPFPYRRSPGSKHVVPQTSSFRRSHDGRAPLLHSSAPLRSSFRRFSIPRAVRAAISSVRCSISSVSPSRASTARANSVPCGTTSIRAPATTRKPACPAALPAARLPPKSPGADELPQG